MIPRSILLIVLGLLTVCGSCGRPPYRTAELPVGVAPTVRLKLGEYRGTARFSSQGPSLVECWRAGQLVDRFYGAFELNVALSGGGLSLMDENLGGLARRLSKIAFLPGSNPAKFQFQGKTYRGNLEIICSRETTSFTAINELDIESYLKGVLPAEMGKRLPEEYEALKAQAVAARTYALYKLQNQKGDNRYLHATVLDQVYQGYDSEMQLSNRAVEETRGQVLTYRGQLICAYYHAICGGSTEDVSNVWGGKQEAYLTSVPDGDFCSWAKTYLWQESFTAEELLEKVVSHSRAENLKWPRERDSLKSVEILSRMKSGRVRELLIETASHKYILKSDDIRWALNRTEGEIRILASTLFEMTLRRDSSGNIISVDFFGRGKGHGVGMCQCGAIGRSRKGYDYDHILKSYYTGAH
ncbi:MAG: SpoIID/LytB domain-containing protein, partial [Candidatus Zixiibacteriota bacterium]